MSEKGRGGRLFGSALATGLLASTSMSVLALASPAQAQEQEADEEIVVTARRYQEYLQDVPLSVTVFSDEELRAAGVDNASDLQYITPSLVITDQNNSRSIATYAIRGLSNGGDSINETSVTPYFAEVPTLAPKGAATLYDMGSVQVLAGPQGTLFGRTSTAGAVLFSPALPEFGEFSGRADVGFGDLGRREFGGYLNMPLGQTLAARLAFSTNHLDGYTERLDGGPAFDERDVVSGRASIDWRPNSTFSNYAVVQYDEFDGTSAAQVLAAYNTDPNGFGFFSGFANPFVLLGVDGAFQDEIDRLRSGGDDARRHTASSPLNPIDERGDSLVFVDIAALDFEFGASTLNIKNIFGYQRASMVAGRDLDGTAVAWDDNVVGLIGDGASGGGGTINADPGAGTISAGRIDVGPHTELFTEELQLSGSINNDLLRWVAGAYFQYQPATSNTDGAFNAFYILDGAFSGGTWVENGFVVTDGRGWERGYYAQGTIDLSQFVDTLHFTAGYRTSSTSQTSTTVDTGGFDPVTGDLIVGATETTSRVKSDGDGWTIALDYSPTDDVLLYITSRAGYLPGGINAGCDDISCPSVFGNEQVQDVEVGAKVDFDLFGRPARFNIAAYQLDYEDIQRSYGALDATLSPVVFTDNVAGARLEGIEIEASFQPTEHFTISGYVSFNDAQYTDYIGDDPIGVAQPGDPECHPSSPVGVCNLDLTNQPFPGNSRYKAGVNFRYEWPLANDLGEVSLLANVTYQDRVYFGEGSMRVVDYMAGIGDPQWTRDYMIDEVVSQDAYTLLNLRADWRNIMGSGASASLFVRNATDELYATGGIPTFITFLGMATRSYGEPRTVGMQLSYEFGGP